jgi:dienelactone hydrolase
MKFLNACSWLLATILSFSAAAQDRLANTDLLTMDGDLAARMVDGINAYLIRETGSALEQRDRHWKRDYTSPSSWEQSVAGNRERLRSIIGAADQRAGAKDLQLDGTTLRDSVVGTGSGYRIHAVRWPVFPGVHAEGLLLQPEGAPVARVVAIPDADWTPEMLTGLQTGVPPAAQFARRLAEAGCLVVVPTLIDRKDTWSGIPGIRMTNLPHREWLYRMAYQTGRHIIGYEAQAVMALVDWFSEENAARPAPIAVAGYGEGGLIALHSAAVDRRIQATLVSGYFGPRENLWSEPVYRDIWSFVSEFGDAELASLVAPRALVIETARTPEVTGPPRVTKERRGATPNGTIQTPQFDQVRDEFQRARAFFAKLKADDKIQLVENAEGRGLPGSDAALEALLRTAGVKNSVVQGDNLPKSHRPDFSPVDRQKRQFDAWVGYTQQLIRDSPKRREEFWSRIDTTSPERWKETSQFYREHVWNEVIGRMPDPSAPANPRSRMIFDEPKYRGYEVVLDVWPGIFAYGILLLPKDIQPGERRPVVVCQHGLEGRPSDVADPKIDNPAYHRYAVRLAEEGFITFAPQNPYIGQDRFRMIQRRGHPLKLALFSFVLGQHQRLLEWLSAQPFVDRDRIGFYGLSYGGKTAVRIPPLLPGYALSICSADFNEWVWKNTSIDSKYSYLLTGEYDMIEFDFASVINYSDLANLMAPRPFMVERGHHDGVAPDEWVAYEFAKTRRFYSTRMNLQDHARIEFFNGPHTIHGKGTFEFLRRHLKWPN